MENICICGNKIIKNDKNVKIIPQISFGDHIMIKTLLCPNCYKIIKEGD